MSDQISNLVDRVVSHTRRRHSSPLGLRGSDTTTDQEPTFVPPETSIEGEGNTAGLRAEGISGNNAGPASALQLAGATDRDPGVAREHGFQGLIPLDDIRSEYAASQTPPTELNGLASSANGAVSADGPGPSEDAHSLVSAGVRSGSLEDAPTGSSNPSYTSVPRRMHALNNQSPASSIRSGASSEAHPAAFSEDGAGTPDIISSQLPTDDGMRALRLKLHEVRDMAASNEEKARKMHELLTADYEKFQSRRKTVPKHEPDPRRSPPPLHEGSPRRSGSPASSSSTYTDEALLYVTPEDIEPTYNYLPSEDHRRDSSGQDVDDEDDEPIFGCKHYMRNVKVQCVDCFQWYTCRHCHDEAEDHNLVRKEIRNMLCMHCGHAQRAAEICRECSEETANYYCGICKLWDNDAAKRIYHCPDCGICRVGEGLGKDYVHCKKCNVCVSINHAFDHKCVERATECDCPICGDWMFSSSAAVVAMKCGHYIHRKCYDDYMRTSYKCPICSRSAVNMELQWRKMDLCLESQPMPERYRNTKAWVVCNDCSMRSHVPFHWLGNKCRMCDSYNTNQIKLVDEPPVDGDAGPHDGQDEAARAVERAQAQGTLPEDLPPDVLPPAAEDARPPQASRVQTPEHEPIAASADADEPPRHGPHFRSRSDPTGGASSGMHGLGQPSQPIPVSRHAASDSSADMNALARVARASTVSSVAATEDGESEDAFGFWGEGIRPSEYLPNGWPSSGFFSHSPPRDPSKIPPEQLASDDGSGPLRWAFHPSQWRLNSPRLFGLGGDANEAIPDEELQMEAAPSSWYPSQWRLNSPRFFQGATGSSNDNDGDGDGDEARGRSTSPGSRSAWPVDPRHWHLNSPRLFSGSAGEGERADAAAAAAAAGREGTSPSSLWDLRPNFLRRLGSVSSAAAMSNSTTRGRGEDEVEDDNDDEGRDVDSFDDEEGTEDGTEEGSEDEEEEEADEGDRMALFGHR